MPEGTYLTRRISRRTAIRGAGIGVAGLAGAALIGCSGGTGGKPAASTATIEARATAAASSGAQAKRGGTFAFSVGAGNIPHLDLRQTTYFVPADVSLLMHKRLMRPSVATGDPEPDIAASFEQPDVNTYIFKLIPGVKFHDKPPVSGRELTAADVVESLKAVAGKGPTYLYGNEIARYDRIEAVDPLTVRLVTKQPDATVFSSLMTPPMVIWAKEMIEKSGNSLKLPDANIGLGPFMVEKWTAETGGTFVRNPNYYLKGQPYIDKVEQAVIPDPAVAWARFQAGELTRGAVPNAEIAKTLADKKYLTRENTPYFTACMLIPNRTRAPFTDQRAITALDLLFDRDEYAPVAFPGRGKPSVLLGTQHKSWWLPEAELRKLPGFHVKGSPERAEDVKNAMSLLSALGYSKAKPMTWKLITSGTGTAGSGSGAGEYYSAMYERESSGSLKMAVEVTDFTSWKEKEANGQFDMTAANYSSGPDPDNVFTTFLHSTGGRNYGKINDPVLDDMVVKQRALLKRPERQDAVNKIQQYNVTKAVLQSTVSGGSIYAYPATLKAYNGDAFSTWQLERAWFDV